MAEYDQIYHCCRFCHWYDSGFCNHPRTYAVEDRSDVVDNLYSTSDNGYIQEAIKDAINQNKITEVIRTELSETRLSQKQITKIMDTIAEKLEEIWLFDWLLDIDKAVTQTFVNHVECEETAPFVVDPETFWCKYYE